MKFVNSKNQELYKEVSEKTEIVFVEFNQWKSTIPDIKTTILFADTIDPFACFTHELLHIKYHFLGLRFPKYSNENLKSEVVFLFNQLSHFKFFKEFCELGFSKESFLQEVNIEKETNEYERRTSELEIEFDKNNKIEENTNTMLFYIALKSPHDDSNTTLNFIKRLKTIDKNGFFSTIDLILKEWENDTSYNSCKTLAKLFKLCNQFEIGFYLDNESEIIYPRDV